MNLEKDILTREERTMFALRSLFRRHGYSQYKMSKFETYDLYARNKDFLVSEEVITFPDNSGKLLAMKPDVTLSIIKNFRPLPGAVEKVYYDERVYRVPKGSETFREIPQAGLECMGDLDPYLLGEVVLLAAESLGAISENFVLDLSHVGLVSGLMDQVNLPKEVRREALQCIAEKNSHELEQLCREAGVDEDGIETLLLLISVYGPAPEAVSAIRPRCKNASALEALEELRRIGELLSTYGCGDRVSVDFSASGDMRYYSGLRFQGFVQGIPESVLSGGQYDGLMARMGKKHAGAIGFAVYLNLLERLEQTEKKYDVDTVLLYGDDSDPLAVTGGVRALTEAGKTVLAARSLPEKLRYRQVLQMKDGECLG